MALDEANDRIYVANFGSTEIAIVDLELQEIADTLFVDISQGTWEGNPYRIALTADGTFAFTSEDQWCDIKLADAATGAHITVAGSIYQPDLVASADGTRLFAGEQGTTGSSVHRFDVTATTLEEVDASATDEGFGSRLVVLSGDGEYVFWSKKKILASNLQSVLGQFSEIIYAANEDGSLAVGNTNVFDGNTFTVREALPVATTVMAMAPDDSHVYLYDVNTSRIHIHELAR
jgi:DNA-binding beta-propeller fold protein YncE